MLILGVMEVKILSGVKRAERFSLFLYKKRGTLLWKKYGKI